MSDDFNARYRLLKCVLVEDGTRTHSAQELASGRVVMVHITDAAGPEEVDAQRTQLAALPASERNKVLEAVTLASGFTVVTEFLPAPMTFRSWLNTNAAAQATPQPLSESVSTLMASPIPAAPAPPPVEPEPPVAAVGAPDPVLAVETPDSVLAVETPEPVLASDTALSSSFSQIFGKPIPPAAPAVEEYPRPSAVHHEVELAPSALGGAVAPPSPVPDPLTVPPSAPVQPSTPLFAAPVAPISVPAPPAAPPAAPIAVAGEFTRMFAPPEPSAPPTSAGHAIPTPAPLGLPSVLPPAPPLAPPSPLTAASSFGYDDLPAAAPPARKPPGDFTMMFGAPETAAPMPEAPRPSPMREAPPPTFSPLTPDQRLESPPVEPLYRVVTNNPNYKLGIQQDGASPIAPNVVGGGQFYPPPIRPPVAPIPPAHASPLVTPDRSPANEIPASGPPGILPPPIFSSGTSTPLSALGGAAPLVNASAGPSDFTRLITGAAEPVLPPLAPTAAATGRRAGAANKRAIPMGLVFVINAVLLIATLLVFFVLRRPVPTVQQLKPARPVILPSMPAAPKLPTNPP